MPPRCQLLSGSLPNPSRILRSPQTAHRTFTTSTPLCKPRGGDLGTHLPKSIIPEDAIIPDYPYGPSLLFKQANKGLYGGQTIQFGNNVSDDTETHTRRYWKPNILTKSLYSIALKKRIKLRITAKVLKTMDREGGLDEYLLKETPARVKELGPMGWALRWRLMQTPEVIARFRAQAAALGLTQDIIDKQWPTTSMYRSQAPSRFAAKQEAEQARLEQEAQKQGEKDRDTKKREEKYHSIKYFADEFMKMRLAPNRRVAEQMALEETVKVKEMVKIFGNRKTALAYRRDRRLGRVERAGGRTMWTAKRMARRQMRPEKERMGSQEKNEAQSQHQEGENDGWGELVAEVAKAGKKVNKGARKAKKNVEAVL